MLPRRTFVRQLAASLGSALGLGTVAARIAQADEVIPPAPPSRYLHGIAQLRDLLGERMGEPLADEFTVDGASTHQPTTEGLAYYLADLGQSVFTPDGAEHWALSDDGNLVGWESDDIAPPATAWQIGLPPGQPSWGSDPAAARAYLYAAYPDMAPCVDSIFSNESGWRMVWNTSGSGAYGVGQFMAPTFAAYSRQMLALGQWPFPEVPSWNNARHQVAVAVWMLRNIRNARGQWTAAGCGRGATGR